MTGINWRPIEDLPEDLKDGEIVLLWSYGLVQAKFEAATNSWWVWDGPYEERCESPTHFAEINEPNVRTSTSGV